MDIILQQNRFGITLDLKHSLYRFEYIGTTPLYFQTVCQHAKNYVLAKILNIQIVDDHTFICPTEDNFNSCKEAYADYFIISEGKCVEIPV